MKEIAIYVEGGGDTAQQKAELRNGFDQLLNAQKQAARAKRLRWKLVPSGGRQSAYNDFVNAVGQASDETLCMLLVDSEERLPSELPKAQNESREDKKQRSLADAIIRRNHVTNRDSWNLSSVPPEHIHLMVCCMEAWIVSDPATLARYYGQHFHAGSLPRRRNLEAEPKQSLYDKLARATRNTSKGEYAKIKHASKLLELIDPAKVAAHCPRFETLVAWLNEQIRDA